MRKPSPRCLLRCSSRWVHPTSTPPAAAEGAQRVRVRRELLPGGSAAAGTALRFNLFPGV